MVELVPPGSDEDEFRIDALFARSGIEQEIVRDAEVLRVFPDLTLPVARIPHLIAMKILASAPERESDRQDVRKLLEEASATELDEARALLRLISERGFDRKKDLPAELESALAGFR